MLKVDYLGEGRTDEAVAVKLIRFCGGIGGISYLRPARGTGKSRVDAKLPGLNAGARVGRPALVLRDLDQDAPCAGELVTRLLPERHGRLVLRICVPTVDAWLLADEAGYSNYCKLASRHLHRVSAALHGKAQLIASLEQHAAPFRKHVDIARARGVPDWASFGEWQATFVQEHWDVARAVGSGLSPSLQRAERALRNMIEGA